MSSLAANPSVFPLVLAGKILPANEGYLTRSESPDRAPVEEPFATLSPSAMAANFLRQESDENSVLGFVCRPLIPLPRSPLRGRTGARRQLALLLRLRRPPGYGFPPNLVRRVLRKGLSGPSANA
jgi:hypothetical protein